MKSIITLRERVALEGLRCVDTRPEDEPLFHRAPPDDYAVLDRLINPKTQPSLVHRRYAHAYRPGEAVTPMYAITAYGVQCIEAFDRNYGRNRLALTAMLAVLDESDKKIADGVAALVTQLAQLEETRRAHAAERENIWRDILAMDGLDDARSYVGTFLTTEITKKEQG